MTAAAEPAVRTRVAWRPHPGFQTEFAAATEFEVLGGGAAGPGKTSCLINIAADDATHPFTVGLFLRTVFTDMLSIRDQMRALYPKLGATYKAEDRRWEFPPDGTGQRATVQLGYGKTVADLERYMGPEFTRIYFDEVGQLKDESAHLKLIGRIRSTNDSVPLGWRGSANPGGVGHAWLKRRFVDATDNGTCVVHDNDSDTTRRFVPGKATDNPSLPASYWRRLNALPEPLRSWLKDGKWDAGLNLALQMVESAHLCRSFAIPPHWVQFGSFDWGYRHPFCFQQFAVNEDGDYFLVESHFGRRQIPSAIAETLATKFPIPKLRAIYAGRDCFHEQVARSEKATPSIAEQMAAEKIHLTAANTARVPGLQKLREFLNVEGEDPPQLRIMRTPFNLIGFRQLQAMVCDPDNLEDVLKVDADDESDLGTAGDDFYDTCRYAIASRQGKAKARLSHTLDLKDPMIRAQIQAVQNRVPREAPPHRAINHPELSGWL